MSQRDDMVFRPRIHRMLDDRTHARSREDRAVESIAKKRGVLSRIMRARAKRMALRSAAGRSMGVGALRMGARAIVSPMRAIAANPIGMMVTAVVVGAIVATRLISGRSFGNMGAEVKKVLLGDASAEAVASMRARDRLSSDEDVATIFGNESVQGTQLHAVFQDLKAMELRSALAAERFEGDPAFQDNNIADIMIVRARDIIVNEWNSGGGPEAIQKLQNAWEERRKASAR